MKILQVRLQNLNSLEGEWEIDFTHPAYTTNSIFAITGPTGAGKTTLLDAICLGLYGCTPRLQTISKSVNEVMTRQTGACFAEVVFSTLKGVFRCHWSQHRARKQPQGDLQQPKHEIVDHNSGTVLENKIRKVATTVEEVTGMNFNQFTRSILLAQGSFAAFLQASADERAPLLEQLTGTSIYSRISQKVHRLTADQEKEYELMKAELQGLTLLSAEELQELEIELSQKKQGAEALDRELHTIQDSIARLNRIEAIKTEIEKLQSEFAQAKSQELAEQELRDSLKRAQSAGRCLRQHERLSQLQKRQDEERGEKQNLLTTLSTLSEEIPKLAKALEKAEEDWLKAGKALDRERATGRVVEKLDVQIKERERLKQLSEEKQKQAMLRKSELTLELKEQAEKITEIQSELNTCLTYFEINKADGVLIENFSAIKDRIEQLQTKLESRRSFERKLHGIRTAQKEKTAALTAAEQLLGEAVKAYREAAATFNDREKKAAAIRNEYPHLTQQLEDLNDRLNSLEKIENLRKNREEELKKLGRLRQQLTNIKEEQAKLIQEIQILEKNLETQELLVEQREEIIRMARRIKSLEQERAELKPGSPCPLCGATVHPYADSLPALENCQSDLLKNQRSELTRLQKSFTEKQANLNYLQKQEKEAEDSCTQVEKRLEIITQQITELCLPLGLQDTSAFAESLQEELKRGRNKRLGLAAKAKELEQIDRETKVLNTKVTKLREEEVNRERDLHSAISAQEKLEQEAQQIREDSKTMEEEIARHYNLLQVKLSPLGLDLNEKENPAELLDNLQSRRDKWQKFAERKLKLQTELQRTRNQQESLETLLEASLTEYEQIRETVDNQVKELDTITSERFNLYGDRNPEKEEKRCGEELSRYLRHKDELAAKFRTLENNRDNINNRVTSLTSVIDARSKEIESAKADFLQALQAQGFADIEQFNDALLPEKRVSELESRFRTLDEEIKRLATILTEKKETLARDVQGDIPAENLENLLADKQEKSGFLAEILQDIGKIEGRKEENEKLLRRQREKREILSAQKKELRRWQKLDQLIGSASGKKFRNFAQGITFDIMVGHANNNLQKMTDRYILVRNELQPLELSVIDNYRGGDIRSTQNLSGGESFLVSLALALGLSSMAGNSVRVDSFFLDEGFGTLDEETLDIALNTLAGLQQEGKMIGIISHVSLLKERLSTQIQLIPKIGGHSVLKGPGVRPL